MRIVPESKRFTILLGVLAGLPALSIDVSSPTLVDLPAALATSVFVAGLTLSLFMVGFAGGLLLGGRISDRIGRRPVLLVALVIFILSGAACTMAVSGPELVVARLVQGAGAGGCSVLAYAMVQDLFKGEAARRMRSYITVILGVVPILAPALGAWLSAMAGWRSVHFILIVAGLILLAVVALTLQESRQPHAPPTGIAPTPLRADRAFLNLAIINGLSYGSLFAYVAGAPVVTMHDMGFSPGAYATLFACTATALSFGAWTSARLGRRQLGALQVVTPALAAQATAAVMLGLFGHALQTDTQLHLALLLSPMLLACFFVRGIVAPNLVHLAMGLRASDAGLASAALGVIQLLSGALASAVVAALLPYAHAAAVTVTMALMAGSAALLWLGLGLRSRLAALRL